MTDQPPPTDPYAKPPSGASAVPPPGPDAQPGNWSSPDSPPPGEYGAPPPPPAYDPPPAFDPPPAYGAPATPGYGAAPAYAAPPGGSAVLSPEASSVRTQGIVWTVINGLSILFCGNLLGVVGLVFGILGITKASTDVAAARRSVRLSWIFFLVTSVLAGIGLTILISALAANGAFETTTSY